ncbi:hypothetical protein BD309DRAFT_1017272 [Dichomitus squalens]|nr:hypothetical protein BD309DRAFT_1017272 [Dichomitus squalens]
MAPDGNSPCALTTPSWFTRAAGSPLRSSHASERAQDKTRFTVRTLRPELVTGDDLITLPPKSSNTLFAPDLSRESDAGLNLYFVGLATPDSRPGKEKRGFLYYSPPPDGHPPFAGELRFRLIPNEQSPGSIARGAEGEQSGSSLFESSSDHQLHPTYHWRLPLLAIAWNPIYDPLRTLLLRDGLVSEKVMKWAAGAGANNRIQRTSAIIHSFEQPFVWNAG